MYRLVIMEAYKIVAPPWSCSYTFTTIYVPGQFAITEIGNIHKERPTEYEFIDDSDSIYRKCFEGMKEANQRPKTLSNQHYQIFQMDLADSLVDELKKTGKHHRTATEKLEAAKETLKKAHDSLESAVRKLGLE